MEKVREKLFRNHDPYAGSNDIANKFKLDIQGWDFEHHSFQKFIREYQPKLIVEVGTWKGASAIHMAKKCKELYDDFEIVCIDTFLGSRDMWDRSVYDFDFFMGRPLIYEQFIANVVHSGYTNNITPFPIDSQNGFLTLKKLNITPDLIYIDAGHDYRSVKYDLENYSTILKQGGILIGDDYGYKDVEKAAHEVFGQVNIISQGSKFVWKK